MPSSYKARFEFDLEILDKVVEEAITWIDTPYAHLGREKGIAADCICLPVEVSKALDLHHHDVKWYSDTPKGGRVEKEADTHWTLLADQKLAPIEKDDLFPGLVVAFWHSIRMEMQHFAIIVPHPAIPNFPASIHAMRHAKKVQRCSISDYWWKRRMKVYALPGTIIRKLGADI